MVRSLILAFLLCSFSANAAYLPNPSSAIQGGAGKNLAVPSITSALSDIGSATYKRVTLRAADSTSTDAAFYGFAPTAAGGHYQVTAGKALYCFTLTYANAGSQHYTWGYATSDFTEETTTPPTGIVYYSPVAATRLLGDLIGSATANQPDSIPYYVTFPASSFPLMYLSKDGIEQWALRFDCIEK